MIGPGIKDDQLDLMAIRVRIAAQRFVVRVDDEIVNCKSCRAPVIWVITEAGKRAPFNLDATSHYSSCPQASTWRAKKGKS